MDFVNRGQQTGRVTPSNVAAPHPNNTFTPPPKKSDKRAAGVGTWFKASTLTLLFSIAILIASLAAYIAFGNSDQESKFVDSKKLQAVFVNVNGTSGGQVYFGHIRELTGKYIRLTNVFYIQNQSSNSQTYTLVKLGCELHAPMDEMVINREQSVFWENLQDDGQLAQKVNDYYKQNPNGLNCKKTTGTSQSSASNSTSNSAASSGTTATTKKQ